MLVSLIALEIRGHESPVIVGTSRNISCTSHLNTVRVEWLQEGRRLTQREDGVKTLVWVLRPSNTEWNGVKFTCRITTTQGQSFNETITIQVRGEVCRL